MIKINRAIPAGDIRVVIFDLDGTLIDSRVDLVNSVNAMLAHYGRPALPGDVIATYVGDGAPMLVRRALGDPDDEARVRDTLAFFIHYYREHKLDHTHLYDGVRQMLSSIHRTNHGRARSLAVLSNKP